MLRVWLEAAWSMAIVWVEYKNIAMPSQTFAHRQYKELMFQETKQITKKKYGRRHGSNPGKRI